MASSFNFECLKAGFSQTAKGYVLRLLIHPDEIPNEIVKAPNGQRYMVALVPMADEIESVVGVESQNALVQAGILCRDPAFQSWLINKMKGDRAINEKNAVEYLHQALGITSRSQIRDDSAVRKRFMAIVRLYDHHLNKE
jgi:hypothetical protein